MIYASGLLILFGVGNSIWSLVTHQVTVARLPLLWYRLATKTTLALIVANYVVREIFRVDGLPRGLTAVGTVLVLLLIGLDWAVEDFVDRWEYRQIIRSEAEKRLR